MGEGIPAGLSDEIAAIAATIASVESVTLLGSRVKGSAAKNSDLDIAFAMQGETPGERLANYMVEVAGNPHWADLGSRYGFRMGITPIEDVEAAAYSYGVRIYARADQQTQRD